MSLRDGFRFGEDRQTEADDDREALPEFDLGYAFDDRRHPREVTVYEHGPDIATRWLTVGRDHAVPLEEVA